MKTIQEECVCAVERALSEVLGEADEAYRDRAESLVAIAAHYRVGIAEALLPWIYRQTPDKEWSAAEWRRWCERYAEALEEARQRLLREMLGFAGEAR